MANIKIKLEYDGSRYSGWQIQQNTQHTVQQILEDCLSEINKAPVRVTGAGRTDAGVHALNQAANFWLDVEIPEERIPMAINRLLPDDIICKQARIMSDEFHAQFDAQGKKYRYRFINRGYSSVFVRNFVYNIKEPLKLGKMEQAALYIEGEHDFASFMASGSDIEDTARTIHQIELINKEPEIWIEITGNGFLYKMVRIIMGTLFEIGSGKKKVDEISAIINAKDRKKAGFTAPAKGLTLVEVYY